MTLSKMPTTCFSFSKDVARTLLAFIYCNQKKFDKAMPLLEEVIRRGDYHLEYSKATEYKNNAECIWGYHIQTRNGELAILALITRM